jgi:hypothetical protein
MRLTGQPVWDKFKSGATFEELVKLVSKKTYRTIRVGISFNIMNDNGVRLWEALEDLAQ